MHCIKESVSLPPYHSAAWKLYTDGLTLSVFDLETTGLSPVRDALILGGIYFPGEQSSLHQYLAENKREEGEVLEAVLAQLQTADVWISYNGNTFDIPFLTQRLRRHGLAERLPAFQSIDLYPLLRRYWPLAKLLPNLRQSSVETALGLQENRIDTIDGGESVRLYTEYTRTEDRALEKKILLHNHDDLLMLHRIMAVLNKLDLHQIMFQRGFMTKSGNHKILTDKAVLGKNVLNLTGKTDGILQDVDIFQDAFHFQHNCTEKSFQLSLPCIHENGAIFLDLERFDGSMDLSPLSAYAGFVNGYLLLHDGSVPYYREMNHMIKILLSEILKKI